MKNIKQKKAFTLAEVLITLGVIGVVSALMMPTLVNGAQKKSLATQARKTISDVQNALKKFMSDERVESFSETDLRAGLMNHEEFFRKYFSVAKVCSESDATCFASNYTSVDGTDTQNVALTTNTALLQNGVAIRFYFSGNDMAFNIDTNGQKGPNKGGKDFFTFVIQPDGSISSNNTNCVSSAFGRGCIQHLMKNNWDMDY